MRRALVFPVLVLTTLVIAQGGKEIVAKWSYEDGRGKIELVGVCKASETDISCWGPDGKAADPDLLRRFSASFERQNASLPLVYGKKKKARAAIFRITNPTSGSSSVSIDGNLRNADSVYSNVDLGGDSNDVRYQTVVFTAKPDVDYETVLTSLRTRIPLGKRIPLKVGAVYDFDEYTYTVVKIQETQPRYEPSQNAGPKKEWVIAMTVSPMGPLFHIRPLFVALDSLGLTIKAVDKGGRPLVGAQPENYGARPFGAGPVKSFLAELMSNEPGPTSPGEMMVYSNIDPSSIASMQTFGDRVQELRITDIPMEPSP